MAWGCGRLGPGIPLDTREWASWGCREVSSLSGEAGDSCLENACSWTARRVRSARPPPGGHAGGKGREWREDPSLQGPSTGLVDTGSPEGAVGDVQLIVVRSRPHVFVGGVVICWRESLNLSGFSVASQVNDIDDSIWGAKWNIFVLMWRFLALLPFCVSFLLRKWYHFL